MIATKLRKGFYIIDILIVSITMLFAWHNRYSACLFSGSVIQIQWLLILYPILLRMMASFLLYQKEKRAIWVILLFLIFYIGLSSIYEQGYLSLAKFPMLLCDTRHTATSLYNLNTYTIGRPYMLMMTVLLAWMVLMPLITYFVLYFNSKLSKGSYSWWDIFGLLFFKERIGILYLSLAGIFLLAYTSGLYSISLISKIALYALPAFTYYIINQYIGRKIPWYDLISIIVAMGLFHWAQFEVNIMRFALLAISLLTSAIVCIMMMRKSKKTTASVFTFVFAGLLLPHMSIGYNIYRVADESVLFPYHDEYIIRGVFVTCKKVVKNNQEYTLYGLRDRYRTIFPAVYNRIKPYDWSNHLAEFQVDNGWLVYNLVTHQLVHSFTTQDGNLKEFLQFSICEELQDNGYDAGQIAVMETNTGKIKAMVNFGNNHSDKFTDKRASGLIIPLMKSDYYKEKIRNNQIATIDILNLYNSLLTDGRVYKTLYKEDTPSYKISPINPKERKAIKKEIDDSYIIACSKMGMKCNSMSGYYAVQNHADGSSVDFCGYYPKKSPKYTFIITLKRTEDMSKDYKLFESIDEIAYYLKNREEVSHPFTSVMGKRATDSRLAQYQLGCCYDTGTGVKQSAKKAFKYYQESAMNGYAPAQWKLYLLYINTNDTELKEYGIEYNEDTAYCWLTKAALQGYVSAQFNLGSAYSLKYIIPQQGTTSTVEANKWLKLAEQNGDVSAREYLHSN